MNRTHVETPFPAFEDFYDELKPQLEKVQPIAPEKLSMNSIIGITLCVLGTLIGIAGGIGYYTNKEVEDPFMLPVILLGVAMFGIGANIKNEQKTTTKHDPKKEVINYILQYVNPTFRYIPRSFIEKITVLRTNFFPHKLVHYYQGKNLVLGRHGNTKFRFSELNIGYDDGDRLRTLFEGLLIEADFHKHFKSRTIVTPFRKSKKTKQFKKIGAKHVHMDSEIFENKYDVFATDPIEARYILSPTFMEKLVKIKSRFDCPVYISFVGSKIYLGIAWKKKIFQNGWGQASTSEGLIRQYYEDLRLCINIIDDLDLNTRIWSKRP